MSDLEASSEFTCPYCAAENSLNLEAGGARRQSFVVDCENCCRPILIEVETASDGYVTVSARPENE